MELKKDFGGGVSGDVSMGSDLVIKAEIQIDLKVELQKLAASASNVLVKDAALGLLAVLPLIGQAVDAAQAAPAAPVAPPVQP